MIIVLATVESTAEDIDALREAIIAMEAASLKEQGNIAYSFGQQISNPHVLKISECWESLEDLANHFKTPDMAAFNQAMMNNPPKSVVANAYDVANEVEIPMPTA